MERTTIFLDDNIKRALLALSAKESQKKGKRIGMAEMIRNAILEYMRSKGVAVDERKAVVKRMLSTKGALGEDYEKRVKEAQKGFDNWKIESA